MADCGNDLLWRNELAVHTVESDDAPPTRDALDLAPIVAQIQL
jgi:hypothetical protein